MLIFIMLPRHYTELSFLDYIWERGCKSSYIKVAAVRVRVYSGPTLMVGGTGVFSLPKPRPNRNKINTSYL